MTKQASRYDPECAGCGRQDVELHYLTEGKGYWDFYCAPCGAKAFNAGTAQERKPPMPKTPTQEPMFKLTEKERSELGARLAQLECLRTLSEFEWAEQLKAHKDHIEGLTEQIDSLAKTINAAGDPQT